MYPGEEVWFDALNLTETITTPGLSPLYPNISCNAIGEVCTLTTGEAEINAATSVMVCYYKRSKTILSR